MINVNHYSPGRLSRHCARLRMALGSTGQYLASQHALVGVVVVLRSGAAIELGTPPPRGVVHNKPPILDVANSESTV